MTAAETTENTDDAASIELPPHIRRTIVGALLTGTFLASMEVLVVGPAMPAVVGDLGRAGLYPWLFTVYILGQTLTIPLYGYLADRRGRRDTYLLGVCAFVVGSILCARAPGMESLVVGRAVQGLGAGGLIPLTMTIFGDLYPVAQRTAMQGIFSLVWGVSSLVGPTMGGWLTETFSWRAIFWLNVVPGALAAIVIGSLLPRSLGTGHTHTAGWATPRLLRLPTQQAIVGGGLLLGAALIGLIGYLPLWVQAVDGGGPLDSGLALLPVSLAWTAAANVAGRLVRRTTFRSIVRLGTATTATGAIIAAIWTASPIGLVLFGFGLGLTISSFTVSAQQAAPRELRASATSLSLLARSIGGAASVPLLGALAGLRPGATTFDDVANLEAGLRAVFVAIAMCAVGAAIVVGARFPESERPRA